GSPDATVGNGEPCGLRQTIHVQLVEHQRRIGGKLQQVRRRRIPLGQEPLPFVPQQRDLVLRARQRQPCCTVAARLEECKALPPFSPAGKLLRIDRLHAGQRLRYFPVMQQTQGPRAVAANRGQQREILIHHPQPAHQGL